MMMAALALGALACSAAPTTEGAVAQMRGALGNARLVVDADGTVRSATGFSFAAGGTPERAAERFVARFGVAMGLHPALAVTATQPVGERTVVRMSESVDGIPVLGAGVQVLVGPGGNVEMALRGQRATGPAPRFQLPSAAAAEVALRHAPALMPAQFTAPVLAARSTQAYLASAGEGLVPVYVFRLDSLDPLEAKQVTVDAVTGAVRAIRPVALREDAPGRVYDPSPGANGNSPVVDVTLKNVSAGSEYLQGDFVETFNCCKRVECLEQGDGGCARLGCVSALDRDAGVESRVAFSLPTSQLPIPAQVASACTGGIPDPLFVDSVFCGIAPNAPRTDGGFVFAPVDVASPADQALRSEEDAFAEVMAYHHVNTFQEHVRAFTGNAQFCLSSQNCTAGVPSNPLHVEVNAMFPSFTQATLQDLICQICAIPLTSCGGKGGSAGTPATLNSYMRVDNAFFQPATDPSANPFPVDIPGLITDYDRLAFFQGTARDFAYDGDVIYHEFGHAVIHTVVTNGGQPAGLNGVYKDRWGVRNEAGALNEGYADYFSESFTDDGVTGEYASAGLSMGELGIRNATELRTCPQDVTGEVHDDSRPWSSALWAIRGTLAGTSTTDQRRVDRAVFTAMAMLGAADGFAEAVTATKAALKAEFSGQDAAIDAAFDSRGLQDCVRALTVVRDVNGTVDISGVTYLQFMGKGEAGLLNFAPGHMQLRMDLPARTRSFSISFNVQGGGIIGNIVGNNNQDNNIVVVVKPDEPIRNTYNGSTPAHDGIEETLMIAQNGDVSHTVAVATGDGLGAAQTYYLGFNVVADNGVTVRDIALDLDVAPAPDAGPQAPDAGTGGSSSGGSSGSGGDAPADRCNCLGTPGEPMVPAAMALLGLVMTRLRRRR